MIEGYYISSHRKYALPAKTVISNWITRVWKKKNVLIFVPKTHAHVDTDFCIILPRESKLSRARIRFSIINVLRYCYLIFIRLSDYFNVHVLLKFQIKNIGVRYLNLITIMSVVRYNIIKTRFYNVIRSRVDRNRNI